MAVALALVLAQLPGAAALAQDADAGLPETHATKFALVLSAATALCEGLDPEIVATIAVHESGRTGHVGFGMRDGRGGYQTSADPAVAVQGFIELVSQEPRYAEAWEQRADSMAFLQAVVRAGYAEDPRWAWKIMEFREILVKEEGG